MATYGEFTPTEDQRKIARLAASLFPAHVPDDFRWRFILPGQPKACVTWRPDITDAELRNAEIKTGLCWVERVPLARSLGFDWMWHVQALGEDFLVRQDRFFMVLKYPSNSDAVGQSDGPEGGAPPKA